MIWFILGFIRLHWRWRWPHWLYVRYLRSCAWQHIRQQVMQRANYRCERCGCMTAYFEIHHMTYERLGRERLTDLLALCKECHKQIHYKSL